MASGNDTPSINRLGQALSPSIVDNRLTITKTVKRREPFFCVGKRCVVSVRSKRPEEFAKMKPSSPSSGPSGALDCGTVHFRELLKLPASRRHPGGTRHMDSPALSVFRERYTSPFTHAMVVDGVERFVGSSEASWGTQQIAGFKTSVERLWSIAPKRDLRSHAGNCRAWVRFFRKSRRKLRRRAAPLVGCAGTKSARGYRQRQGRFHRATFGRIGFEMEFGKLVRRRFRARKKEPAHPGSRRISHKAWRLCGG
jgi:hypothetical protein